MTGLARHLEMKTRPDALDPVDHGIPVRNDDAFEAPFFLELLGQHHRRLRAVDALHPVVARHDRPRLRLLDGDLERCHVDLVQSSVIDVRVHVHALRLDVVCHEVLHRRTHSLALHTVDVSSCKLTRQQGVLAEILEVATAQRRPLDVHSRSQEHVDAQCLSLLAQCLANLFEKLEIPGRRQARSRREAGSRRLVAVAPRVGRGGPAQTVGTVGDPDEGNVEPRDGLSAPRITAGRQRRLLLQCQLGNEPVDPREQGGLFFGRLCMQARGGHQHAGEQERTCSHRSHLPGRQSSRAGAVGAGGSGRVGPGQRTSSLPGPTWDQVAWPDDPGRS